MTDRKLPLPKIPRGTVSPVFAPENQRGIPVESQPIRAIPGGMRVVTDPETGEIQRDPRGLPEGRGVQTTWLDAIRDQTTRRFLTPEQRRSILDAIFGGR